MALIAEIASRFPSGSSAALGPFLRAIQAELNWVPREAMEAAVERFGVSYLEVYERVAFSPGFSLEARGELVLEACQGLACREAGAAAVLQALEQASGLKSGETGADGKLTLCRQICFGRCAIGPNLRLKGVFYANQSPESATALLRDALQNS
jgi:NADH:ubiquinone oxidoreductase subunit E